MFESWCLQAYLDVWFCTFAAQERAAIPAAKVIIVAMKNLLYTEELRASLVIWQLLEKVPERKVKGAWRSYINDLLTAYAVKVAFFVRCSVVPPSAKVKP
jgi:hypothetical protein